MSCAESKRDPAFDLLKGIAIFMVVLSHVIGYRDGFSHVAEQSYTANFIAMCNMHIFFAVSGYFSVKVINATVLLRRIVNYFWPCAVFAILYGLFNFVSWRDLPFVAIKAFFFNNWFFWVLAFCDITLYLARKSRREMIVLSICLIISSCVANHVWYMSFYQEMLPFYVMGFYFLPTLQMKSDSRCMCMSLVVYLMVVFFSGNVATNGLGFYWDHFVLVNPSLRSFFNLTARLAMGVFGVCALMFISNSLISHFRWLHFLGDMIGRRTLQIFFIHGFLVHSISNKLCQLDTPMPILYLSAVAVTVLSVALTLITETSDAAASIFWGPFNVRKR